MQYIFGLLGILWRSLSHMVRISSSCAKKNSFQGFIGHNGNLQGLLIEGLHL